jgi:hypothetical protein
MIKTNISNRTLEPPTIRPFPSKIPKIQPSFTLPKSNNNSLINRTKTQSKPKTSNAHSVKPQPQSPKTNPKQEPIQFLPRNQMKIQAKIKAKGRRLSPNQGQNHCPAIASTPRQWPSHQSSGNRIPNHRKLCSSSSPATHRKNQTSRSLSLSLSICIHTL